MNAQCIKHSVSSSKPNNLKQYEYEQICVIALFLFVFMPFSVTAKVNKPWNNGRLTVSENHRYLVHQNGTPFFWLGNTAWLLPERLNQDEVEYFSYS